MSNALCRCSLLHDDSPLHREIDVDPICMEMQTMALIHFPTVYSPYRDLTMTALKSPLQLHQFVEIGLSSIHALLTRLYRDSIITATI